ncbi:MAG: PfkB family carbohydrate kinase [Planctomycetota bacterium]|jgi:sugar/nucleoside kinase (ribokinase family)
MPLLVVGSVGIDTVETPHGKAEDVLGGSAVYFSWAASFFVPVRLVSVVGSDFPEQYRDDLSTKDIDMTGLEVRDGKTFRWSGQYKDTMHVAETLSVDLNVFGQFAPNVPEPFRDSRFVFLANGLPTLQMEVLDQMNGPVFVAADTMNHWISDMKPELLKVLKRVDGFILNDAEARQLTEEHNLIKAARALQKMGPSYVIIKKGEHGALLVSEEGFCLVPGYPTEHVKDPTGAGDTFAGGTMGYLAKTGTVNVENIRQAIIYGTVLASFNVEGFSIERLKQIDMADLESRRSHFASMVRF